MKERLHRAGGWLNDRYHRTSRWADQNPLAAYVLLVLTFSFALWRIGAAVDDINTERSARSEVVANIIDQFCNDNNGQDDTLAALVAVSLRGRNGGFGQDVDTSQLTAFDMEVIASIQRIQNASGDQADLLTKVFERKLEDLRKRQDCEALVEEQRSQIEGCRRGNLQRAYELANKSDGPARFRLARDLQPIVNCQKSIRTGRTVLVTLAVEREYVRIVVEDRRWPILAPNGTIDHTLPLPSSVQDRR